MYLQQKQAAEILRMSRMWVWTLIKRGELTVAEIAGRKFVVDDDRFKVIKRRRANGKG